MTTHTIPTFPAKFVTPDNGLTWCITAKADDLTAAVKAGHAIIAKANGKTTCRPIMKLIDATTAVVGPKCAVPGTERKTAKAKAQPTAAPKAQPIEINPTGDVATMLAEALTLVETLRAQLAGQATAAPIKRERSAAQLANDARLAEQARARRQASPVVAAITTAVATHTADANVDRLAAFLNTGKACPCCGDGRGTYVHHAASALLDPLVVRTCKPCLTHKGTHVVSAVMDNAKA